MGTPASGQTKVYRPGQVLRAIDFNRGNDSEWANRGVFPTAFAGGGIFPGGMLVVPQPAGASAAAPITLPWAPFSSTDPMSGDYQANFQPGTIGGILPTNMFTPLALTQSMVNAVYLAVTAAGGIVTGATITASTTYPTIAASTTSAPPTAFNVPIALWDLTGATPKFFNIVGFGNIWVQPYVSLLATISTGALLTAPFTPSYNWEWGAGS